ncbi:MULTISPECIES: DUF2383 domain-containing protein [Methylocaldum]|jgi:uncharacterized protein (TIGR02284 family)|uniref:DUF2383 domain-containing protein n=1 Tax=unclassified Methylocaldum TaxID=2622260 RepID=UPI00098A2286|nr:MULTISPECIES: DUF2383 domain-containing protein [unclassified Methylocaldum]MBP1151089.1 uncharacterized protein (TIGR02284 family) [Methylocaldum sp. RMAD-M]MVF22507.1 DUF2383 domain-containing protein [Methylocaldum sp. BRCS4]
MPWDESKLNTLLRDEISAVETYQQALDKLRNEPQVGEVQQISSICEDHRDSANKLRERIIQSGGKPTEDSGAWGTWSKMVMGGAKLLGDKAALTALRQGEENGIQDYQEALLDADIPADVRNLIQTTLLPRQQQHLNVLNRLIGTT